MIARRNDFDVVIVGGGMVGACVAALLARAERVAGWSIAVVEPAAPKAPLAGAVDLRVSALSRASERILRHAGAWPLLEPEACPYSDMVVWDAAGRRDGRDVLRFSAAETGEPNLKMYLKSFHKGVVQELDWCQEIDLAGDKKLICLPAQHWSRRFGQGFNETVWASFLLITPETSVYYGGDSGYFVGYKEIGRRFPHIDYALLSTTAYHPRWFMHYAHMSIPEALDAFHDLEAKYFIPTQWGTFQLGDEPPGYPALDLMKAIEERKLDPSRFLLRDIGEIRPICPMAKVAPSVGG